jgi:putative transposase
VKGRKRHLLLDTTGLILKVLVHAADSQDRDGGKLPVESLNLQDWPRMKKLWADGAYSGSFEEWLAERTGWTVEIVSKPRGDGFHALPRRWVVEPTFAWLGKFRRLRKDYEALPRSEETWIYLGMTGLMLARLEGAAEGIPA